MIIEILIALSVGPLFYFIGLYIHHLWTLKNYPDGPFPLPIIGNLHLLGEKSFEVLNKLGQKYGEVYSISLGMERVVILNSIEAAKDGFTTKGSDFAGRPTNLYTTNLISRGGLDIVFSDYGKKWKFLRKFAHQSLRMYGDGMEKLENMVLEECESLDKRLKASEGKPIDINYDIGKVQIIPLFICGILL